MLYGLLQNPGQVQPRAIIGEAHRHVIAGLLQIDRDRPDRILARTGAHGRFFYAVNDTIAQQVLECRRHAIEHAPVHFNRASVDVELDLFGGVLGRLPHDPVQAFGNALELHHAGAQQILLQCPGLARLGDQIVFRGVHRALQIALHRGHVVDRFRHHAGQFLHPREAVKLQWVKVLL